MIEAPATAFREACRIRARATHRACAVRAAQRSPPPHNCPRHPELERVGRRDSTYGLKRDTMLHHSPQTAIFLRRSHIRGERELRSDFVVVLSVGRRSLATVAGLIHLPLTLALRHNRGMAKRVDRSWLLALVCVVGCEKDDASSEELLTVAASARPAAAVAPTPAASSSPLAAPSVALHAQVASAADRSPPEEHRPPAKHASPRRHELRAGHARDRDLRG